MLPFPHLVVLGKAVAPLHDPGPSLLEDVRHRHKLSAGSAERESLGVDLLLI